MIVVATTNKNKLKEWRSVLEPKGYTVMPAVDVAKERGIGLEDIPENGATFLENATARAVAAANTLDRDVYAEDSGLSLAGTDYKWPGLHSNRFLGGRSKDGNAERQAIIDRVKELQNDKARYDIAIVRASPDGGISGRNFRLYGKILEKAHGDTHGGAGAYYPIFKVDGDDKSLAEMLAEYALKGGKEPTTHRRLALEGTFK